MSALSCRHCPCPAQPCLPRCPMFHAYTARVNACKKSIYIDKDMEEENFRFEGGRERCLPAGITGSLAVEPHEAVRCCSECTGSSMAYRHGRLYICCTEKEVEKNNTIGGRGRGGTVNPNPVLSPPPPIPLQSPVPVPVPDPVLHLASPPPFRPPTESFSRRHATPLSSTINNC